MKLELYADIGLETKEQVLRYGINIMDYAVFSKNFLVLKNYISCRSLDDRFGCFVLEEAYKATKFATFAWTVQEEIGLKGAKAIANNFKNFELAIAIDSFACCSNQNKHIKPGKGPIIRFVDNSGINSFYHARKIIKVVEKHNIPIQVASTGGGTDGSIFVEHGIPFVALSIAVKYLHSTVEMLHKKDLEHLINLVIAIIEEVKECFIFYFLYQVLVLDLLMYLPVEAQC